MLYEVEFGSEAISYIQNELLNGSTFAKHILNLIPLTKGHVKSFLPSGLDDILINNFYISLRKEIPQYSRKEFEKIIASIILDHKGKGSYIIFETLNRPGDSVLKEVNIPYFTYGSEVYFFLNHHYLNIEQVLCSLRRARAYPGVIGLTSLPHKEPEIKAKDIVSDYKLKQLALRLEQLLIGAYDDEGYLIWHK